MAYRMATPAHTHFLGGMVNVQMSNFGWYGHPFFGWYNTIVKHYSKNRLHFSKYSSMGFRYAPPLSSISFLGIGL